MSWITYDILINVYYVCVVWFFLMIFSSLFIPKEYRNKNSFLLEYYYKLVDEFESDKIKKSGGV